MKYIFGSAAFLLAITGTFAKTPADMDPQFSDYLLEMANSQELSAKEGILEVPLHVQARPPIDVSIPGLGSDLMNMVEVDDRAYIENKLTTYFDIQIFSKIYIGSNHQEFLMLYDSGSSQVWVEDKTCVDCRNPQKFYSEESTSFWDSGNHRGMRYGKGQIYGKEVADTVCLTQNEDDHCMDHFRFLAVQDQQDLHGLRSSGLIGMAPPGNQPGAQLFVPSLYKSGAILKNQYSVFIDVNGQSKILFGGYDLEKYAKPGKQMKWYPLVDNKYWSLNFGNVWVGDKNIDPMVTRLIADTGTSLLLIPERDYHAVVETAVAGMDCRPMDNGLTGCTCTTEQHAKIPDIYFDINDDSFTIPRNEWFAMKDGICIIKITHHPNDSWILGLNFFTNYYAVFDYENEMLGLVESINSNLKDDLFLQWAGNSIKNFKNFMRNVIPSGYL